MKYNFPKVELHLHLDGSLDLYEAQDMALAQGLMRPEEGILALRRRMEVQPDCQSLEEYLRCFRLPGLLLQSAEALERASYRLLCNCVADGVAYAEVRFAPQLHMQAGLKQEDAIEAVLHGMQRACAELPIDAGLLLCAMVTGGEDVDKQNALTFELAGAYRKSGVVGVDLAGDEGKRPMEDFRPLFQRATHLGIPFTIHAGEASGPETIRTAVSFGAHRIGHGCSAAQSASTMDLLRREGITLEMCPTSNLQTHAVPSLAQHPIRTFYKFGIPVCVSTDNRTVSCTTLEKEYEKLQSIGFSLKDLVYLNCNAVNAAFMPKAKKDALLARLETWL